MFNYVRIVAKLRAIVRAQLFFSTQNEKIEAFILEFVKTKNIPQEILDFYYQFEFSNYVECVKTFK